MWIVIDGVRIILILISPKFKIKTVCRLGTNVGFHIMEIPKENRNPSTLECGGDSILNTLVSMNPEHSKVVLQRILFFDSILKCYMSRLHADLPRIMFSFINVFLCFSLLIFMTLLFWNLSAAEHLGMLDLKLYNIYLFLSSVPLNMLFDLLLCRFVWILKKFWHLGVLNYDADMTIFCFPKMCQ